MKPETLFFFALVAVLLVLMLSRSRRQQREALSVQARVEPGTRVMTTAGLYATVVSVDDEVVVLETAPGQHSRWDKRVVARIVEEPVIGAAQASAPAPSIPLEKTSLRPSTQEHDSSGPGSPPGRG